MSPWFAGGTRREKIQGCFNNNKRTPKVQEQHDSSEFQLELNPGVHAAAKAKIIFLSFSVVCGQFYFSSHPPRQYLLQKRCLPPKSTRG